MIQGNIQEHVIDEKKLFNNLGDKEPVDIASQCEAGRGHVLHIKRKRLAIVFVPGIMASRLENGSGKMVWDPDSLTSMLKFLFAGPARRQHLLLPDPPLSVPPRNDEADRGDVPKRFPHAMERGWHTVSWQYYGNFLESLEEWATPLKAFIDMRVYAFGYDWLQSNSVSGKNLHDMLMSLNEKAAKAQEEMKVILVSHSMGGLVARSCIIMLDMLKKRDLVLGVIHGAQPAMGAPAAYRRQKAGFEAHSLMERLTSLALGKDGPNVRAIFPFRSGPLELLPCKQYHDPELKDGAWFSHDILEDGEIISKSIPPADIYTEVYTKFDDECYYGMLNRKEFYQGMKFLNLHTIEDSINTADFPDMSNEIPFNETQTDATNNIMDAALFHDILNKHIIHPRTIQLFSRGKPTCCAVHWKAADLTDKIMTHFTDDIFSVHSRESIRDIIPRNLDRRNDYYELRWIEKDGTAGECILTSRRGGKFISGKTIQKLIRQTGRRVALFNLTKPAQDGKPDRKHSHWSMDGDGTVPVASVLALPVSAEGWPEELKGKLPAYCREEQNAACGEGETLDEKDVFQHGAQTSGTHGDKTHNATKPTGNAEHSRFFDKNAIQATKQAIHNLCVAWLKGDIE